MSMRVDIAPLIANSLVVGDTGLGVLGSEVPSSGVNGAGYIYNDLVLPADANKEVYGLIVTQPTAGTLVADEDTSFTFSGAPDGAYFFEYQLYVDGVATGGVTRVDLNVGAGGADYTQSVLGSITPTGQQYKKALKLIDGSITPIGSQIKRTSHHINGSLSISGALSSSGLLAQLITGSITPTGSLSSLVTYVQSVSGSITPTSNMIKKMFKSVVGIITPTGAQVKKTSKSVSGSTMPTGNISTSRVFIQLLSGALSGLSGTLGTLKLVFTASTVGTQIRRFYSYLNRR